MKTSNHFFRSALLITSSGMLLFMLMISKTENLKASHLTPNLLPALICTDLTNRVANSIWVSPGFFTYGKASSPASKDVEYTGDIGAGTCTDTIDHCRDNDTNSLIFKIYAPVIGGHYGNANIPVLLFFHPSGFQECANYTDSSTDIFCREMAYRNFCVFNVEYRRGILKDLANLTLYTTAQQQIGVYRACQDGRGALRYIIHELQVDSLPVKADYTKIFLGGFSAGGVIALNMGYYKTQRMVDSAYPSITTGTGNKAIRKLIGEIEADYYKTPPDAGLNDDGTPAYRDYIKGVIIGWGATPVPLTFPTSTDQQKFFKRGISDKDYPPIICFHGDRDSIFPISPGLDLTHNKQWVFFDPLAAYNSTSYCQELNTSQANKLQLESSQFTPDIISASSKNMYEIVKAFGRWAEMYWDCEMRHGLDGPYNFRSDFGTGDTTRDQVLYYMAGRAASFFQRVLNYGPLPYSSTEKTLYIECENTRKGCDSLNTVCTNDSCDIDN